jgi:hypothetical protein
MPNYIYLIFIYCFSFSFLSDVVYAVWNSRGFALYGLLPWLCWSAEVAHGHQLTRGKEDL